MANFVRLNDRLSTSVLVDVTGSGWGISGRDVLPVPEPSEDARAAEFVADQLRLGVLVEADESDYQAIQESNQELLEMAGLEYTPTQVGFQAHAEAAQLRLQRMRSAKQDPVERRQAQRFFDDERERKRQTLALQERIYGSVQGQEKGDEEARGEGVTPEERGDARPAGGPGANEGSGHSADGPQKADEEGKKGKKS